MYKYHLLLSAFLPFSSVKLKQWLHCDVGTWKYIDFKRYRDVKMSNETGAFTDNGYHIYHGINQNLAKVLLENLGMKIADIKEQKILRIKFKSIE